MSKPTAPEHHPGADPRAAAPQTVERYCEDLVVALRMRDVSGRRIGEILAEIRDHLRTSGEDPAEAFGTPQQYAADLTADVPAPSRASKLARWVGFTACAVGIAWTDDSGRALLTGGLATLTEADLIIPAVVGAAITQAFDASAAKRRGAARGWVAVAVAVFVGLLVVQSLLGPLVSVDVPALALFIPGLLLIAGAIAYTVRSADPVVDPLQDPATTRAKRRRDRVLLTLLWLPLLAAIALLIAASPSMS
ncbi:hypothetical protein CLV92_102139 [Kineococcus xinjiangensis]|uniref:Uncharacterized protein n=1 Tax=Kineococcus xinjiangensis TaxID=512762 RepID=A0A2S6IUV2_9ACTN|nr:hypothetical protein [Kineococcus xinjiangensis]PPK97988.1 hypothetical protein CLV92_102139 [Kineococcus xinjiangensis]